MFMKTSFPRPSPSKGGEGPGLGVFSLASFGGEGWGEEDLVTAH
jgi:hypothetical protein